MKTTGPLCALLCAASSAFAADVARAETEAFEAEHDIDGRRVTFRSTGGDGGRIVYDFTLETADDGRTLQGDRIADACSEWMVLATSDGQAATDLHDRVLAREGTTMGDLVPAEGPAAAIADELLDAEDYEPPMAGSPLHLVYAYWRSGDEPMDAEI